MPLFFLEKKLGLFKSKKGSHFSITSFSVRGAGLEPATKWSQDFKSCVSTNSTTRAKYLLMCAERKTGFEPATPTLAGRALPTRATFACIVKNNWTAKIIKF